MTCICSIVEDGIVYMGADSAASNGYGVVTRKDPKLFKIGDMLIGYTSSYRMGQLLKYNLSIPKHHEGVSVEDYLYRNFIDEVRNTLKIGGYMKKNNEVESGGSFILAYRGRSFTIENDFQIGECVCNFSSVGCGQDVALGAMYATQDTKLTPIERIKIALNAAEEFSLGVRGPFIFETLEPKDESN